MPSLKADQTSQLLYAGAGQYLVVNLDTADTVYLSQARGVYTTDVPLPPQASVALSGPWYVSTCDSQIVVDVAVVPGSAGGYSNPVGVQIALAGLGLAKDATLLGGGTLAQPAVPNMRFASLINQGPAAAAAIVTPAANYRLWSVWLSFAAGSDASYTNSLSQFFASVEDPAGQVLAGIELALLTANQLANDSISLPMPGIPIVAGDAVVLNVNGGTGVTNTSQRAAGGVMYSMP